MTDTNTATPPSLVCAIMAGDDETDGIPDDRLRNELNSFLEKLGERKDVFLLPPDYTRFHSKAGKITQMISEYYKCIPSSRNSSVSKFPPPSEFKIMPALGTHAPMTDEQIKSMYGQELSKLHSSTEDPFLVHDWRNDVVTIGHVPSDMVRVATNGMVDEPWPAQLNKAVWAKRHEAQKSADENPLILSIGQVVPHEVMGMANFNKNLFVGVGGLEAINLSHFIGAVYGMEKMMGRASNPLRAILNKASEEFLEKNLNLWYILTVVAPNGTLQGLFIGNTIECYTKACELSMKVNFTLLEKSPSTMVVHLDPDEFHSTWLGNKSIYRTRLAIADGGDLIVLAPGVRKFGEDDSVDVLIRKYGYMGTPKIMDFLEQDETGVLQQNLGAVAHLIHGSTEGRFNVTYCMQHVTKEETEGVGFQYAPLEETLKIYDPANLSDGWNTDPSTGKEFFYISNPALGLWAVPSRFEQ
mmetsp:Transcript_14281/g.35849  ORF Transcript_14281/g.35849 Transcript_14281/m.35849 type:complete len:469 (-) Transcript_14281:69-1475(-)